MEICYFILHCFQFFFKWTGWDKLLVPACYILQEIGKLAKTRLMVCLDKNQRFVLNRTGRIRETSYDGHFFILVFSCKSMHHSGSDLLNQIVFFGKNYIFSCWIILFFLWQLYQTLDNNLTFLNSFLYIWELQELKGFWFSKRVSRVFQGSFKGISSKLQDDFKSGSTKFQGHHMKF